MPSTAHSVATQQSPLRRRLRDGDPHKATRSTPTMRNNFRFAALEDCMLRCSCIGAGSCAWSQRLQRFRREATARALAGEVTALARAMWLGKRRRRGRENRSAEQRHAWKIICSKWKNSKRDSFTRQLSHNLCFFIWLLLGTVVHLAACVATHRNHLSRMRLLGRTKQTSHRRRHTYTRAARRNRSHSLEHDNTEREGPSPKIKTHPLQSITTSTALYGFSTLFGATFFFELGSPMHVCSVYVQKTKLGKTLTFLIYCIWFHTCIRAIVRANVCVGVSERECLDAMKRAEKSPNGIRFSGKQWEFFCASQFLFGIRRQPQIHHRHSCAAPSKRKKLPPQTKYSSF